MIATAAAITAALTTALTAIGVNVAVGTTIATVLSVAGWVGASIVYGGMALSCVLATKSNDYGSNSSTYKGLLQTQTNQNLPVPLLYGTCKLAGNRIWQDENSYTSVRRIVAFAEGEICEYSDIKLNDIPADEIAGISIQKYYGTNEQTVDSIIGGANQSERAEKVGSLKNLAYLAITVPRSTKIDLNYNLTAVVKGRKIRVYKNKYEYEIKYSENPAWVMFDFLTCYNGLGLCIDNNGTVNDEMIEELFDLESFIESAAYCDELIESKEKNEKDEEITVRKPRFTFNMIFDAQTSARTLIDEIYRSCRGGLFVKNGRLQFKIDKAEQVCKIFTEKDIIKGSETFQTIPKEEHYDILKCSYISPKHEWQKVEATAELPEYRDGVPIEHSINIYSVTDFHQASRLAWYYINAKRLQPYFGSFQTDYKGYDLEVGDVICFDSILMGLEKYKVKVTSVTDNGAGVYTINWRTYDDRLYTDELGSKEPRVLVSKLEDISRFPDDVTNFNVTQTNNLFNFVWQPNENTSDSYEIRMGERWENSTVLKSKITENKYTAEVPTSGLYKFWIKAFNSYNYSENATLDVINVDSVPSLNEIVKLDILENIDGKADENIKVYKKSLKLKEKGELWKSTEALWSGNSGNYQTLGCWGAAVFNEGIYESQIYDIGANLKSIVTFDYHYTTKDEQNDVLIEWCFSENGEVYTDWTIINTGTYTFRYCKFKITLRAVNNVQTVLTKLIVGIDVPDKEMNIDTEIIDPNGLLIEYKFINAPSIVATVNDNIDAYVVVSQKTAESALLKAYTNSGELTCAKVSVRIKGY